MRALAILVNVILEGNTPQSVHPILFGASLHGRKRAASDPSQWDTLYVASPPNVQEPKSSRPRGSTWHPSSLDTARFVGEAAAHASFRYLYKILPGYVMVKLDFKNAFNCVRRDKFVEAVEHIIPTLYSFVFCPLCI